jgi:uncharacterized protein (TIGR02117 family)
MKINYLLSLRLLYISIRYFLIVILSSFTLLTITALIPRKWSNYSRHNCNFKVCISNTGLHTNIIVPTQNKVSNWHNYLSLDRVGIDTESDYKYLSFGWGDRAFYLSTPTLADLKFSTTFNALFLPTPSVMYVKGYQLLPNTVEVKCIQVNQDDYLQLVKYIEASFQLDGKGKKMRIANGHTSNAGFYAAVGDYSILNNCNTWTAKGLRKANVNTPLWDGFSSAIMWQLRSGCE